MKKIEIKVKGMSCVSCEQLINNSLNELESVTAKADFVTGKVKISYNEEKVSLKRIHKAIEKEGYKVVNEDSGDGIDFDTVLKCILIALGLNMIFMRLFRINIIGSIIGFFNNLVSNVPVVSENTSLVLLFVIGLLTSFHCVAMCGGINVSQCMAFKGDSKKSPNLMYNLGRVTSYTLLGGVIGLIGSVFSISISTQAILYVVIGCFMVLMAINLFGFNFARKFLPKMPKGLRNLNKNGNAPFVVGLLNGLMPCGPLQSMQLYALSTGSFFQGALSMFLFSVGTVPLMYIFGKIGDFKNPKIAKNFMKVSAVLVLILGLIMANRGLSLLGFNIGSTSSSGANSSNSVVATVEGDEQVIVTDLNSRSYPDLTVKKGVKVKWIINADSDSINGCNNEIIMGKYGVDKKLQEGENIIEFMPDETGTFGYSCWMGMIRASVTVVE